MSQIERKFGQNGAFAIARGAIKELTVSMFTPYSLVVILSTVCIATPAAAYIDPNIGGQIYQALYPILAVLLGVLAFARQWVTAIWHRFSTAVRSLFSRQ